MNTSLTHRLVATAASIATTFLLLTVVAALAEPPLVVSQLAQAATVTVR